MYADMHAGIGTVIQLLYRVGEQLGNLLLSRKNSAMDVYNNFNLAYHAVCQTF